jgi:hypothetical protein
MTVQYSKGSKFALSNNQANAAVYDQEMRAKLWPQYRDKVADDRAQFDQTLNQFVKDIAPRFGGGICLALVLKWIADLFAGGAPSDFSINTEQCKSLCIQKQSRFQTNGYMRFFAATEINKTPAFSPKEAVREAEGEMYKEFGLAAFQSITGTLENSFEGPRKFLYTASFQVLSKFHKYMFSFTLSGLGSHVIGIHVTDGCINIFDPNYGFYSYPSSTDCEKDLKDLFYGYECPYAPAVGQSYTITAMYPNKK